MTERPRPRQPQGRTPTHVILLSSIVLLVSLAIFASRVEQVFGYTLDDSFITFRYATHLAHGDGLSWNVGETPRTEGCTSFLWMAVLSLASWLQADLELTSKILSIAFILTTAVICLVTIHRSIREPGLERLKLPAACLGASLFLLNAHLPSHAVSGMETALALLLMTIFFAVVAEYIRLPAVSLACLTGLTAFLLGLVRPEANLAILVAFVLAVLLSAARGRLVAYGLAPYLMFGAIYFAWRWSYFELLFPLPFYVKQMGHGLVPGLRSVLAYVIYQWPIYPFLLIFLLGLWNRHRDWIPAAGGVAATLLYFIFPQHIMGSDYRFVFPTYALLTLFAALGFARLVGDSSWLRPVPLLCLAVVCLVFPLRQWVRFESMKPIYLREAQGLNAAHIPLGRTLATLNPDGRRVLAISDAGAVPFYSGWRTLDTFGLNNREIALALRSGYDPALVLSARPDIIVLISNRRTTFDPPLPFEGLIHTACQAEGYQRIGTLASSDHYYLWLMIRDQMMAGSVRAALADTQAAFAE